MSFSTWSMCVCAGGTGRQTLQVTLPSVAENSTPVSFGADYTKDSLEGLNHMSFEHVQTLLLYQCVHSNHRQ